jgi:hypothetical protein
MSNYNSDRSFLVDELTQKVVSVTTSATELFTGGSRNARRQVIRIYNDGNSVVYLGPLGVTSSGLNKGEPLQKNQSITYTLGNEAIYAITDSSTSSVIVTELA